MNNLQLSLITKWFKLTKPQIKTEDYRSITPYWCNRFLLFKGEVKSKEFWDNEFFNDDCIVPELLLIKYIEKQIVTFKQFDFNIMTLGYPKSTDTLRILKLEHKGIEIREGNPDWGAKPGKLYFVIKHGKIINE